MTDSMFPPPGQPLVADGNGNGTGQAAAQDLLPWSEAGDVSTDGAWEEPQWDEPQVASNGDFSSERLTPAALRSVVFRRAALGKRGLDEQQVNNLLDRVETELVRLTQEKRSLEAEVKLLRDNAARQQVTVEPEPAGPVRAEPQARPKETGLARVDPAEHAASRSVAGRVQEAHVYAASLLSQAQQTADQYIKDAQRYSRELVEDALLKRGTILSSAAAEGDRTVGADAVGREIARLREANQTYRGKLRDYFELMLMNLDEWETAEGAGGSA